MNDRVTDVDANITELLDITENSYIRAVQLVCKEIEIKEPNQTDL